MRTFAGLRFSLVGAIEPERDTDGIVREYLPQSRYAKAATTPLNPHGAGPFSKFSISKNINSPGVYVLTVDSIPVYAGRCENLARRWGGNGYGAISPKNCFVGGQSTNCKVNNRILERLQNGQAVELWFHPTNDIVAVEQLVLRELNPEWNHRRPTIPQTELP